MAYPTTFHWHASLHRHRLTTQPSLFTSSLTSRFLSLMVRDTHCFIINNIICLSCLHMKCTETYITHVIIQRAVCFRLHHHWAPSFERAIKRNMLRFVTIYIITNTSCFCWEARRQDIETWASHRCRWYIFDKASCVPWAAFSFHTDTAEWDIFIFTAFSCLFSKQFFMLLMSELCYYCHCHHFTELFLSSSSAAQQCLI